MSWQLHGLGLSIQWREGKKADKCQAFRKLEIWQLMQGTNYGASKCVATEVIIISEVKSRVMEALKVAVNGDERHSGGL